MMSQKSIRKPSQNFFKIIVLIINFYIYAVRIILFQTRLTRVCHVIHSYHIIITTIPFINAVTRNLNQSPVSSK